MTCINQLLMSMMSLTGVFYIVIYRNYYKILMSFSVWYFSKVMSLSRILFLLLLGRKDEKKCTIKKFSHFFIQGRIDEKKCTIQNFNYFFHPHTANYIIFWIFHYFRIFTVTTRIKDERCILSTLKSCMISIVSPKTS